jgi:hypothetical protein
VARSWRLRHAYAHAHFLELAGFPCPVMGGPHAHELTPDQRADDDEARLIISREMGPTREAMTVDSLGRSGAAHQQTAAGARPMARLARQRLSTYSKSTPYGHNACKVSI